MSPLEEIHINLGGIAKGISDGNLAVPVYQRSYAWEEQHIRQLFQDLATAITENEPEYFLGTIVLIRGTDPSLEVVDGQQRLATSMILLAAIRDYFFSTGDTNRASDIEREFLVTRDLRSQERVPKLRLNDVDHDFFHKAVLTAPNDPVRKMDASKESHKRIKCAAELAEKHVGHLVALHNNPWHRGRRRSQSTIDSS
jgi:Protein of unknown function DUF262